MQNLAVILSGPPLSGKSTWAKKNKSFDYKNFTKVISRDDVRMKVFCLTNYNDYLFTSDNEAKVTRFYWSGVDEAAVRKWNICFDNTFCKESYIIDHCAKMFSYGYEVKIVWFDVPLWKLYLRNYIRRIQTGKWIPLKVIRDMKKNHQKINRKKYEHMVYE